TERAGGVLDYVDAGWVDAGWVEAHHILRSPGQSLGLGYSALAPPGPGGTTNVQPSSRPRKLPRIRSGMYRPGSTCSQAGPSSAGPPGTSSRIQLFLFAGVSAFPMYLLSSISNLHCAFCIVHCAFCILH